MNKDQLIKENILIVDNDLESLTSIKQQLMFEFNVFLLNNTREALDLISSGDRSFAVIVADIKMSGINGIKFLEEVKNLNANITRIILTGNADMYSTIQAINEAKVFTFLQKPWNEEKLVKSIEKGVDEYRKLRNLSDKTDIDELTGLYKQETIYKRLHAEILRSLRYLSKLTILMFDIDNLVKLERSYGKEIRDKGLKVISESIAMEIRKTDIIGRFGENEFLIIFPETALQEALVVAKKIRKELDFLIIPGIELNLTLSGGLAEFQGNGINELLETASNFIAIAQQEGGNRIKFESPST